MAKIPHGPTGLAFRVQKRGEMLRLITEVEATDEIIVVLEMTTVEATALAAQLLLEI